LVVEGFSGEKVFVNDPALGHRIISTQELDNGFSGVALTFKKGNEFKKGGDRPSALRALRRRLQGHSLGIVFVAFATFTFMLPSMVAALLPKVLFDSILGSSAEHWSRPILVAMAATALLLGLTTFLQLRAL